MVVGQGELDLIRRKRRRMMRLPVTGKSCPLRTGRAYRLQSTAGRAGEMAVTILAIEQEPLESLDPSDAKREGYRSVEESLEAWQERHGVPLTGQQVWVVQFVRDDAGKYLDQPHLLRQYPGALGEQYTSRTCEAMPNEPEAIRAEELVPMIAESRVREALRRDQIATPKRAQVEAALGEISTWRAEMSSAKSRSRVRRITHDLTQLAQELRPELA